MLGNDESFEFKCIKNDLDLLPETRMRWVESGVRAQASSVLSSMST